MESEEFTNYFIKIFNADSGEFNHLHIRPEYGVQNIYTIGSHLPVQTTQTHGETCEFCITLYWDYMSLMKVINFKDYGHNVGHKVIDALTSGQSRFFKSFTIKDVNHMAVGPTMMGSCMVNAVGRNWNEVCEEVKNLAYNKYSTEFDQQLEQTLT